MPNIAVIGWYDPFELLCSLRPRLGLFKGEGTRVLNLRGPKKDAEDPDDEAGYVNAGVGAKWPELRRLIDQIRRDGERLVDGPMETGRVFLEQLDPGAVRHWRRIDTPYTQRFTRVLYCLRSNPGSMIYSGTESVNLLPGTVTTMNLRALHAAVNHGDVARVYLLLDLRKREEVAEVTEVETEEVTE